MTALAPEVARWEAEVLQPALQEVCDSPALRREYDPTMFPDTSGHAAVHELREQLVAALRRTPGTTLAIARRDLAGLPAIGGRYVVTAMYRQVGETWCASPGVIFWMKFNNKLHAFDHRYDNAIAAHAVADITKYQVQNHILGSFDFFKLHAFSDRPFPGYR